MKTFEIIGAMFCSIMNTWTLISAADAKDIFAICIFAMLCGISYLWLVKSIRSQK